MLELLHPDDLSPRLLYQQAHTLAAKTSRARLKDWYRSPLELPVQWHIWVDGGPTVVSALRDAKTGWRQGPEINPSFFLSAETIEKTLASILLGEFSEGARPKSLGVILHIADEFNLADLAPDHRADADFNQLRQQLFDDPAEVLADKKVNPDSTAWRLLPYWGAEGGNFNCTAITVSRERQDFLRQLRRYGDESNVPVRTIALSAPLEALASFPLLAPVGQGEAKVVVFQYLRYTVLYAISQKGELISARALPHRGNQGIPANFSQVVMNMAINHNMANPPVYHFAMGKVAQDLLLNELRNAATAQYELHIHAPALEHIPALSHLPAHRPEFCLHDQTGLAEHFHAPIFKETTTFSGLRDGWALQDFDRSNEEDLWYPTQMDLQLLKLSTVIITLMLVCAVGICCYGGYRVYTTIHQPTWTLAPEAAIASVKKMEKLNEEKKTLDYAEGLFISRSKGWEMLEFLQQLIPERPGQIRIDKVDYSFAPAAGEPSSKGKGKAAEKLGFNREWKITGLAQRQEYAEIAKLNSQTGLHDFFKKFASLTGDQCFDPDPETRTLSAQITKKNNETYNPTAAQQTAGHDQPSLYPVSFEILLTQNFSDHDPVALIKKETDTSQQMSRYTPVVVRLGILVPGAMNVVILGAVVYGYFWFAGEKTVREHKYAEHMERLKKCDALDEQLLPRRPRFKEEMKCLTKDLRQELSTNFTKATDHFRDYEIQQISVSFPTSGGAGTLDSQLETPKSRMQTVYKGGFGPMEEALFKVENQLPQLAMEKLSIARQTDAVTTDGEHLTFTLNMMGWNLSKPK